MDQELQLSADQVYEFQKIGCTELFSNAKIYRPIHGEVHVGSVEGQG